MPPALSCPCPPSSFTLLCLPARKGRRRALALGPSPRSPCRAPGHPYGRRVSIAASSGRYGHSSSPRAFLLGGGGGHLSGALMYRWRRRGRSGGREVWPTWPPVLHWLGLPPGHAEGTKHRAERLLRAHSPRARRSRSCPSSRVYGRSRAGPALAQLLVPARCLALCEARGQQIQNPCPMAYAILFSACVCCRGARGEGKPK